MIPRYDHPKQYSNFNTSTEAIGCESLEYRYLWCGRSFLKNLFLFFFNFILFLNFT